MMMKMKSKIVLLLSTLAAHGSCVQVAADIAPHFILRPLPYPVGSLEPFISSETMLIHHGKHVQAYVDKANELTAKRPELHGKTLEELIASEEGPLFNQVGQIWNHNFFFQAMKPPGASSTSCSNGEECEVADAALADADNVPPASAFRSALLEQFESFDSFKDNFRKVASGHFGSGWAWLVLDHDTSALKIVETDNGSNPLKENLGTSLLGLDVWEHAYYIDHRNVRPAYIDAFWNVVNWDFVVANYNFAKDQIVKS